MAQIEAKRKTGEEEMTQQQVTHAVDEMEAEGIPWQEALSRLFSGPDHSDPNARD